MARVFPDPLSLHLNPGVLLTSQGCGDCPGMQRTSHAGHSMNSYVPPLWAMFWGCNSSYYCPQVLRDALASKAELANKVETESNWKERRPSSCLPFPQNTLLKQKSNPEQVQHA